MTKVITDEARIDEVLTRGVDTIMPGIKDLKELMMSGKRLRLYQGFDPTATDLHIGNMVGMRKLAQFQDLGHEVIFLVGDGTGQAGDPSGKTKARDKFFNSEELRENAKDYLAQAGRIVSFGGDNPVAIKFNGDWLNKLTLPDILGIASNFTLQQLSERDMFQERMKKGEPVNLREFLYPLLQGYDSVAMDVDLEIGGSDQLFNMMTGRTLQKTINGREKFVLTIPLLTDKDGRKIGKSEGNSINITGEPSFLFGQVMSLPDEVVMKGLSWLTDVSKDELKVIADEEPTGENKMKHKKRLAFEIVKDLNDTDTAQKAQVDWEETFSKGGTPEDTREVKGEGQALVDIFVAEGVVTSKTDFRRLIADGAVSRDGEKVTGEKAKATPGTYKIGKHRFLIIT